MKRLLLALVAVLVLATAAACDDGKPTCATGQHVEDHGYMGVMTVPSGKSVVVVPFWVPIYQCVDDK